MFAFYGCWLGVWLVNKEGVPLYHDFTCAFVAGLQALHGNIESIYVPAEFISAQEALVGAGHVLFSNWPTARFRVREGRWKSGGGATCVCSQSKNCKSTSTSSSSHFNWSSGSTSWSACWERTPRGCIPLSST